MCRHSRGSNGSKIIIPVFNSYLSWFLNPLQLLSTAGPPFAQEPETYVLGASHFLDQVAGLDGPTICEVSIDSITLSSK